MHFREREAALGRDELILPLHYLSVDDVDPHRPSERHDPAMLELLRGRQWIDFRPLRFRDPNGEDVALKLAALADSIRAALRRGGTTAVPPSLTTTARRLLGKQGQLQPVSRAKPELRLSMSGGNVFVPDAADVRAHLTGIALDVQVWNTGAPSVATGWELSVVPPGFRPVSAQLTAIPEHLQLAGDINSKVLHAADALDVKTGTAPIGSIPVRGTLLFYVKLAQQIILSPSTRLELVVLDVYSSRSIARQTMGNWLQY